MKNKQTYLLLLPLLLLPAFAYAHPNHLINQGFLGGFNHPFTGLDHTLAMISVGLLASVQKKSLQLILPGMFLLFMALGGTLGWLGVNFPYVEFGISLSLIGFGYLLMYPSLLPQLVLSLILGAFALCHGYAHGVEMLPAYTIYPYAGGFLLATALLHLSGFIGGMMSKQIAGKLFPLIGVGVAISSLWI